MHFRTGFSHAHVREGVSGFDGRSNLCDAVESHMLATNIKHRMRQHKLVHSETGNSWFQKRKSRVLGATAAAADPRVEQEFKLLRSCVILHVYVVVRLKTSRTMDSFSWTIDTNMLSATHSTARLPAKIRICMSSSKSLPKVVSANAYLPEQTRSIYSVVRWPPLKSFNSPLRWPLKSYIHTNN